MLPKSYTKSKIQNKKNKQNYTKTDYFIYFSRIGFDEAIAKSLAERAFRENWKIKNKNLINPIGLEKENNDKENGIHCSNIYNSNKINIQKNSLEKGDIKNNIYKKSGHRENFAKKKERRFLYEEKREIYNPKDKAKEENKVPPKGFIRWVYKRKYYLYLRKRKSEMKYFPNTYMEEIKRKNRKGGFGKSKHDIYLGKILSNPKIDNYYLSEEDLQMHVLIHGKSGQGKTTALKSLIYNIKKKFKEQNFLYIAFKDDANDLMYYLPNVLVLKPGENFSINIFNPRYVDPFIYANKLVDMITSSQEFVTHDEFSPQMEKILFDIFLSVIMDNKRRNWDGFDYYCEQFINNSKNKSKNLELSIVAVQNRLRRLKNGGLKHVFGEDSLLSLSDIMNMDIILDLSSILRLGGGLKDQIFFGNMIFHFILTHNARNVANNKIRHFTIVEEASYFGDSNVINSYKGSPPYLDLVQHYRGKGECIISVTTSLLHPSIMGNVGVFMAFKMEGNQDIIAKYLALPAEKDFYITMLKKGECIVNVNSLAKPFILSIQPLELQIKPKLLLI
ncbi:MAG: hypothetical protein ACTSRZ_15815 [Promethearchaeota archaeon]